MLHEAIFLATCNATMMNKNLSSCKWDVHDSKATCLATLRKVEGRSTFLATQQLQLQNGVLQVTFFLATCSATFFVLQVARTIVLNELKARQSEIFTEFSQDL